MTQKLVARLREILTSQDSGRKLCILLGAGVTATSVPEVPELTSRALGYLDEHAGGDLASSGALVLPTTVQSDRISRYSEALWLFRRMRGADELRVFLQQAALKPFNGERPRGFPGRPLTKDEFGALEEDVTDWNTPFGLRSLASIIRTFDARICPHLLTTNFDGLLQVALRGTTPNVETVVPRYDAAPPDGIAPGTRAVVHLHGDCRSSVLHSPAEVRGSRPQLESWLSDHLRDKVFLVVGYSGWDDTIRNVLRHDSDGLRSPERARVAAEVLWAVYENEHEHRHINSTLADFFQANPQQVDPYYGIDSDRLFQELEEAVRRDSTTQARTTDFSFYEQVRKFENYQFGHSPVNPAIRTRLAFWPHRLREPHLIHGVHALTAIHFSKIGIPVELHLDDIGIPTQQAEVMAAEFIEAVHQWFAACGVPHTPRVYRFSKILSSMNKTDSAARLWGIAKAFNSKENTAFDALAAAKVIETDGETVTVPPSSAQRLLRPLYTWLALEAALDRHDLMKPASGRAVTLGGHDEQKMWDLWRKRSDVPPVASVYVPYLEAPAEGTDLWHYPELRRDTAYGQHDLARFLRRMQTRSTAGDRLLEWVYIVAVKLAATVSIEEVTVTVNGRTIDSWEGMQAALRTDPAAATAAMARAVATWFQASPIGPA